MASTPVLPAAPSIQSQGHNKLLGRGRTQSPEKGHRNRRWGPELEKKTRLDELMLGASATLFQTTAGAAVSKHLPERQVSVHCHGTKLSIEMGGGATLSNTSAESKQDCKSQQTPRRDSDSLYQAWHPGSHCDTGHFFKNQNQTETCISCRADKNKVTSRSSKELPITKVCLPSKHLKARLLIK